MALSIDPLVTTTTLPMGLAVTTVALPHLHTAACGLFVKVGARFEVPRDNGLSHFVEHMLFRGTERYPTSLALNEAVERLGSTLHAETGADHSLFQLSLEPRGVDEAIEVLGELFSQPRFGDIELERALVLEEINNDYDENGVEVNADDIARGLAFDAHPLGQRIIGPRENVARFTLADVRRHFEAFYGARNAHFCVAGPVDHASVVDVAQRAFAAMPSGQRASPAPAPAATPGMRTRHVDEPGSQTTLAMVFRGVPELDADYVPMLVLLRVLDGGMSSRLHYTLADQKGLAYSIDGAIEPLADTALFSIHGSTTNAKAPALVRELLKLLDGLRRGEISEAELARARARYRYETLATLDDAQAMAAWFGGAALYFRPPLLSQRLTMVDGVTRDDLVRVARAVLRPEGLAIATVGTLSRPRLADLRRTLSAWGATRLV